MKTFTHISGLPELKSLPTIEDGRGRHYITPSGLVVPSVTTVLGHAKKKSLQEWRDRVGENEANRISSKASNRGNRFHNLCEQYFRNEKVYLQDLQPDTAQSFLDTRCYLNQVDNIHYIETALYSEQLGIAGRTDIIGEYAGVLSIIDLKTSNREKKEAHIQNYFQQATAYALMYEELIGIPINQIVVLIAVDHDLPQLFIKDKSRYIEPLMETIEQYKKDHSNVS